MERLERVNTAGVYGGHPYFRGAVINGDQLLALQAKKDRCAAADVKQKEEENKKKEDSDDDTI